MAQQTAVEWLEIQFDKYTSGGVNVPNNKIFKLTEKAKAMEKEQMINAGNKCAQMHKDFMNMLDSLTTEELYAMEISTTTFGEQYYNETYK